MNINELITIIVQSLLVPLLIWGILEARNYLVKKIKNEQARAILAQATDAAQKAVAETAQVYVDAIKGTKNWNAEAQREAAYRALHRAEQILGQEGVNLLYQTTGSVRTYLEAAIEQAVRDGKEELPMIEVTAEHSDAVGLTD